MKKNKRKFSTNDSGAVEVPIDMRPYNVYDSSSIEEDSSSNDGYISSGNDNVSSSVNARDSSDAIAAPTARETNSVHHANRRSNESVNIRNNEIYRRTSSGERSGGRSTTPHQEEDPVVAKLTDLATARYLFEERLEASENCNTWLRIQVTALLNSANNNNTTGANNSLALTLLLVL